MVVFVVLYLVVFHLHFSTAMEEKVARARFGEILQQDAMISAALYFMTLLQEDLEQDLSEAQETTAPGPTGPAAGGDPTPSGGGADRGGDPAGDDGGGGQFRAIPMAGAGAGIGARIIDYLRENMFQPNVQTVGETKVKITNRDGERCFDLNLLFTIAPLHIPGLDALGNVDPAEAQDLVDSVAGASDQASAEKSVLDWQRRREEREKWRSERRKGGAGGSGDPAGDDEPADGDGTGPMGAGGAAAVGPDSLAELAEFEEPDELRIQATTDMLRRAVDMVFSMNEDSGFLYSRKYDPQLIAGDIVSYVLERRGSMVQNIIYHPSELLNLDSITPEVYYGPQPSLGAGEEMETEKGFLLRRDEYGDLVAEYLYGDEYAVEREDEMRMLEELQEDYGQYASFPGLGRLSSNPLLRGVSEPVVKIDEYDNEYVLEPRIPLGLKDIFTTFSSGKININTASVPVLYGLLLSLDEGPDGEAHQVAWAIHDYRNYMQPYMDEEGVDRVGDGSAPPELGQPKRQLPPEEDLGGLQDVMTGLGDVTGMSDFGSFGSYMGSQELETNYFTNLQQIQLIDFTGELFDEQQIDRVSEESDSLLQRVINDFSKVSESGVVFSSTFFSAELKAKTEKSPLVKTGLLVVKRDLEARLMEVIMWKELQK